MKSCLVFIYNVKIWHTWDEIIFISGVVVVVFVSSLYCKSKIMTYEDSNDDYDDEDNDDDDVDDDYDEWCW